MNKLVTIGYLKQEHQCLVAIKSRRLCAEARYWMARCWISNIVVNVLESSFKAAVCLQLVDLITGNIK